MATFSFTNISSEVQYISDFPGSPLPIPVGDTVEIPNRVSTELPAARELQRQIAEGLVSFVMTPSADEIASGLLSPPVSITGDDIQPVAATDVTAAVAVFHKEFAAPGGGGTPADVVLFAANAIPFKCRLLDVVVHVTTTPGASTAVLRDEAAGAGTVIASIDSSTVGRKVDGTRDATDVLEQTTVAKGLFLRLSDDAVAGSVTITFRRES